VKLLQKKGKEKFSKTAHLSCVSPLNMLITSLLQRETKSEILLKNNILNLKKY
jgi:hypothetical protein